MDRNPSPNFANFSRIRSILGFVVYKLMEIFVFHITETKYLHGTGVNGRRLLLFHHILAATDK